MQIGFPTDVKHVAHIGWDGPSVNSAPSWVKFNYYYYFDYIKSFHLVIITRLKLPSKGKTWFTLEYILPFVFYMQMNEFKSPPGFSSAPLANGGEVREEDPVKWVSQGTIYWFSKLKLKNFLHHLINFSIFDT